MEVIKATYMFKRYAKCIELCNQVVPLAAKAEYNLPFLPNVSAALLYRGKAFFKIYQREQEHFQATQSALPKKEFYLKQNSIYEKAGEVISNLGLLLDTNCHPFLDNEMSMFLDISMIDIAYQVNELKKYSRCLLCLNKAKLRKSHLCPDSILSAFADGLEKAKDKHIFNLSFFKDGKKISPHGITKWLFCEKCENILSRDGETHFIPKFFRRIYNSDCPQQPEYEISIPYDEWLYRFSIGVLFRGLINEAVSSFVNSDKIHQMFSHLRKLILFEGTLHNLPHNPDIYMLISPCNPHVSAGLIGHVYHAPFLFALTDKDLQTGSEIIPRACQFFLARIGIINFLLPFDDAIKELLPAEAQIKVSQGEFVVPSEAERASVIPNGINQILEDLATATQMNVLESSVSTMWRLKLSDDATPPSVEKSATYMTHKAMSSDTEKLQEVLFDYSLRSPQTIDLLPPGFHVDQSNGIVSLPDDHQILFHGDFVIEESESFHVTLFLAVGTVSSSSVYTLENPYVIFHRHQPGLKITIGFFVNPNNFSALKFLPDPSPKILLHKIGNQLRIKALSMTLLPELMELKGLKSYQTVVHRATLQR